jgi:hypothetical protein
LPVQRKRMVVFAFDFAEFDVSIGTSSLFSSRCAINVLHISFG